MAQKTRDELLQLNLIRIFENDEHEITGQILQDHFQDIIDSFALYNIPTSLTNNKGNWNANTNTPTIISGIGDNGDYYTVNISGTTNIDNIIVWNENDYIWFDSSSSTWQKIDNSNGGVAIPDGISGMIQFNEFGIFKGDINLFWDNINKNLGIGYTSPLQLPQETLHILRGNIRIEDLKNSKIIGTDTNGNLITVLLTHNKILTGDINNLPIESDLPDEYSIIDILYYDLQTLKTNNQLKQGYLYRITDHITKHLIPNTTEIRTADAIEPLILLATSINTFDKEVFSSLYPTDIIYYDINDNSCEDGTWNTALQRYEGGTARNGRITYRKDTKNELETHYDWRNVKFRRWDVDATLWISGTIYDKLDVIKSTINNNIYVCKIATSGIIDPSLDTVNWQLWLDITTETNFWSCTSDKNNFDIGDINTINLILNNTTPNVDYKDFYTFTIYDELSNSSGIINGTGGGTVGVGYKSFIIDSIDKDYIDYIYNNEIESFYNNTLFYLFPNNNNEYKCYLNVIKKNSHNNTIVGNMFYYNAIGDNFSSNIVSNTFNYNIIENNFNNNVIENNFNNNVIGNNFNNNIIGDRFQVNTIKNAFNSNITGNNFTNNIVKNDFFYNIIGNYCNNNVIGNNFVGLSHIFRNQIGNNFQYNHIENFDITITNNTYYVINDNFQNNYVKANSIPDGTDFTTATFVYGNYDCEIFRRQDGTSLLKYMDDNNSYQFVSITA